MGLLARLRVGAVLTKDSLLLIRHHPRLVLFPILSGLFGIAFLGLFLGVTFGLAAIAPEGGAIVGLLLAYLALTFVSSLFTAGLVHQTREVLAGGEISLRDGLDAAWNRKTPLFVWSVIAATVGVVINMIEGSDSSVGRLFAVIFSVAWTLMTFFIIPVIVFERPTTTEMFKRSASTFKRTYGETPISLIAIQIVGLLVALPLIGSGLYLAMTGTVFGLLGIGLFLFGIVLSFIVSQTLQGVVKTSLYFYAEEGIKPEEFDNVDFDSLSEAQDSGLRSSRRPVRGEV